MTIAIAETQNEFRTVSVRDLSPSKVNPRRHHNEAKDRELADSIKRHGVLEPLLVRPLNGKLEIVAGRRRFDAAKTAGVAEIPVRVREMSDADALEIAIIENLQREDVHPLDEAEGFKALQAAAGYDVAAIAGKVGKSESYVYQRLKLADLIPPAKEKFLSDALMLGHAILLAKLQPKDQAECLKWVFQEQWDYESHAHLRVAQPAAVLKKHIELELYLDLHSAPWKKDDATLVPAAGACTTCPKRTGNQPALFPDLKHDTCTDRACFAGKLEAFMTRRQHELPDVLKVSEAYSRRPSKDVLTRPAWEASKKGACASTKQALMVDGDERGQLVYVCADSKCKKHHEWHGGVQRTAQETAQKKQENQAWARQIETRRRLVQAISAKVTASLTADDLKLVAAAFYQDIWSEYRKKVAELLGWERAKAGKHGGVDYEQTWARHMAKAGPLDVARALVLMAMSRDFSPNYNGEKLSTRVMLWAKRYKVNTRAIGRDVVKELRERQAKAKARKQAKAKKEKAA